MIDWNPILRFVKQIKKEYIEKYGELSYEKDIENNITCLENWINKLDNQEYLDIISLLQINQKDKMILIRYGRYSNVFGGESEITNDNFWDLHDGFYKECRSVVIDLKKEALVLCPFKKFRNLNECEENNIDKVVEEIKNAKSVEITNKLDGSMQSARLYDNEIIMSGSQALDKVASWRLENGYKMLTNDEYYVKMITENPKYTFIFEYITLKDAHVVNYKKEDEGLYLVGMRNTINGEQLSYNEVKEYADKYQVKMTQIFNKTFNEVIEDIKRYKSDEMEGYVINIDGHLIKVKCDDYVQIHRILSNISSINLIIKHIADGIFDDLISKVPEGYKWRVMRVANLIFDYLKNTDKTVKDYYKKAPKDNKKEFMVWVDNIVPKEIRGYVRNIYLDRTNNYIKSGNEKSPCYKKLNEMGIEGSYSAIFVDEVS